MILPVSTEDSNNRNNNNLFFDSLFINPDLRSIYYITKKVYCIRNLC